MQPAELNIVHSETKKTISHREDEPEGSDFGSIPEFDAAMIGNSSAGLVTGSHHTGNPKEAGLHDNGHHHSKDEKEHNVTTSETLITETDIFNNTNNTVKVHRIDTIIYDDY